MNLLLDTHILIWMASRDDMMSAQGDALVNNPGHTLWFSVVSLWEITIKRAQNRPDFRTDANVMRAGLLRNDFRELPIEGRHCLALTSLPPVHSDPFDRMLLAQATAEGMQLVTSDRKLVAYDGPILKV